jgi:uncharacterized protein YkwD
MTAAPRSLAHRLTTRLTTRMGAFGMTLVLSLGAAGGLVQQCTPPPPPLVEVYGVQEPIVASVNWHRANAGIAGVTVDSRLTSAAQSHANDMANRRRMTHTGSDGSNGGQRIWRYGYGAFTWAENVAAGQPTAEDVMRAWMNSAGHRANIMNGRMVNIGVAAARGSNGVMYWTMVLAG